MAVANQAEIFPNEKHSPTEEEIVCVVERRRAPPEAAAPGRLEPPREHQCTSGREWRATRGGARSEGETRGWIHIGWNSL